MLSPALDSAGQAEEAIHAAAEFLCAAQDADGCWRDYALAPGPSESWTTACAGYALLSAPLAVVNYAQHIQAAVNALQAVAQSNGWGYNRNTACDADSTSWSIRFLVEAAADLGDVSSLLRYVLRDGSVATFVGRQRFGNWAQPHDEVAPVAGLAMIGLGQIDWVGRIRASILRRWRENDGWCAYWWTHRAYVVAQSLEFLSVSGGIPKVVAQAECRALQRGKTPDTAFDISQQLITCAHLKQSATANQLLSALLAYQQADGGWEPSLTLRVPDQRNAEQAEVHCDSQRILGTSFAIQALRRWQQISQH